MASPQQGNVGAVSVTIKVDPATLAQFMGMTGGYQNGNGNSGASNRGGGPQVQISGSGRNGAPPTPPPTVPPQPTTPPAPPPKLPLLSGVDQSSKTLSLSIPLLGEIAVASGVAALALGTISKLTNTLVENSKIAQSYLGAMGKVFGAAIDTLLIPFTPVFNMLLMLMMKLYLWIQTQLGDKRTQQTFSDNVKALTNPTPQNVYNATVSNAGAGSSAVAAGVNAIQGTKPIQQGGRPPFPTPLSAIGALAQLANMGLNWMRNPGGGSQQQAGPPTTPLNQQNPLNLSFLPGSTSPASRSSQGVPQNVNVTHAPIAIAVTVNGGSGKVTSSTPNVRITSNPGNALAGRSAAAQVSGIGP